MMVEKRKAVHTSPPAMRRDSSAVGLKAKLKITTTSNAKNSMELIASLERHSRRRSLRKVDENIERRPASNAAAGAAPDTIGWDSVAVIAALRGVLRGAFRGVRRNPDHPDESCDG